MSASSRKATIYFDSRLHRALRVKAAETDRSISDLVNHAVRTSLAEDADDLAAFETRLSEPRLRFEDVVKGLTNAPK